MKTSKITSIILAVSSLIVYISSLKVGLAQDTRDAANYLTFELSSLLPKDTCKPSPQGRKQGATLEVVHRYGACSKRNSDKSKIPSHAQIHQADQDRVRWIQSRVSPNKVREQKEVTLPAYSGVPLGTGNYYVNVGLGTPKTNLSLIFDTGSDLTWTQCQPCTKCYIQQDPIFNPSGSSSYANVSCQSQTCSSIVTATSQPPTCSGSTCSYELSYGDSSTSTGLLAKDTLTLDPINVIKNFTFGCAEYTQGLFGGTDGLVGLGRDKASIVYQTASTYKKYFSYCLPSLPNFAGYLKFGRSNTSASSKTTFTPILTQVSPSFYSVNVTAMSVGGIKFNVGFGLPFLPPPSTILDSGTVITRLHPAAYAKLTFLFKLFMLRYPRALPFSILDTCYDLSKHLFPVVPEVSFYFEGGARMKLDVTGILYPISPSQVCLGFANNLLGSFDILGNVQQKTFDISYDLDAGKIGFTPGACI